MKRLLSILALLLFSGGAQAATTLAAEWQAWTNSVGKWNAPLVAYVGDSITAGFGIYDTDDPTFAAPSGEQNGNIARVTEILSGNTIICTNLGTPGAGVGTISAVATNTALLNRPKYMIVQGGVNDVALPGTFADVKVYWDNIRVGTLRSNVQLIVQTIFPCNPAYATAAGVSNYNYTAGLVAWCIASNVPCIEASWYMREPSNRDAIISALQSDLTHLNTNGIARWAKLCFGKINEQVGLPATYYAWDGTENGRDAAIGVCTNSDTVTIPACAVAWSNSFNLTKPITLSAAGIGYSNVTNWNTGRLINVTLSPNGTNRFTGFDFWAAATGISVIYVVGSNTDGSRLRVDNNATRFLSSKFLELNTVVGVADHNLIYGKSGDNVFAHVKCSLWNGLGVGNGVWTNATPLYGSEQSFFFEDNICIGTNLINYTSLIDAQAGGRYVFRYNTVYLGYVEGHGSEAQYERSTHAVEVYENTWWQSNFLAVITYYRGGSGLVFSNSINDVGGNTSPMSLLNNRPNDPIFVPFGGSDGRNPWDVNNAGNPFVTGTASSAALHEVSDSGKSWTVNQWAGSIVRATSGQSATVTRSGSTITVSCTGHGFSSGDLVCIFGADQYPYNNRFIITVSDANTFTATLPEATPATPATGTIKVRKGNWFAEIVSNTATKLVFKPSIYENENNLGVCGGLCYTNVNLTFYAGDTYEINKIDLGMDMIGVTGGSLVPTTATPTLPGAWNDQTFAPWYQWGNNRGNQTGVSFGIASGTIVLGRNATNDTVFSYSRFTYPHPLVSGSSEDGGSAVRQVHSGNVRMSGNVRAQ